MVAKMNSSKIFKWLKNGATGKTDDSKIKQTNKYLGETIQEMTQGSRIPSITR